MTLNGARVYSDGVEIGRDSKEKIQQIVDAVKSLSSSSEVSFRFLKSGRVYEALLWGKASDTPIGVYTRGHSLVQALDSAYNKVKRECLKILRFRRKSHSSKERTQTHESIMEMAG